MHVNFMGKKYLSNLLYNNAFNYTFESKKEYTILRNFEKNFNLQKIALLFRDTNF